MTHNAIAFSSKIRAALAAAACLMAVPAMAQDDTPVNKREPDLGNVASTPANDLNLSKDEIPEILLRAVEYPYDRQDLASCPEITAAIAELDAYLGPDFDIDTSEQRRLSAGRLAKSALGSLIPFRGIVRELTGAAGNQRDLEEAIMAGAMRRGYLKGIGDEMGCPYPARPADPAIRAAHLAKLQAEAEAKAEAKEEDKRD